MLINDHQYLSSIETIKQEIKSAQYRAVLSANSVSANTNWRMFCLRWKTSANESNKTC